MFEKSPSLSRPNAPAAVRSKSQWSLTKGLGFRKSSSSSSDSHSARIVPLTPSPTSDSGSKVDFTTPKVRIKPQLAHTPPRAPAYASSNSTLLSLGSPGEIDDCCFCDIPLSFTLEREEIAKLGCTHLAHFECLSQLTKVLNHGNANNETLKLPPCGMCDASSTLANAEAHAQFIKNTGDDIAAKIARQPAVHKLHQTVAPFHQRAAQASSSHSCSHPDCRSCACDINLFTQLDTTLPSHGPGKVKCLISLSAPDAPFMKPAQAATYRENALMLQEVNCLQALSYRGVSLNAMNFSRLRFIHKFRISSDLFTWTMSNVFLFDNLFIITQKRGDITEVKTVYKLQEEFRGVKIVNRGSLPYLQILTQSATQKARLFLVDSDSEAVFALCAALHDNSIQFPMAPSAGDTHLSSVCEYTGQLASRSPTNFIMCLEMPSTPRQAHAILQSLGVVRDRMSNFDRCGLVLQGPNGIVTCDFQRKDWNGWAAVEKTLSTLTSPLDVVDFDKSLEAAEKLLRNFRVERSLAAITIVSFTNTACLSLIANAFVYSDTPIITIGLDDSYDHFALDIIATKTDGYFISCESTQLKQFMKGVFKYACSRTHKNIEVKLRPSPGCTVAAIEGWAAEPISLNDHKVTCNASDIVYRRTKIDQTHSVPLGSLSEQTTKSFIVTLDIADCSNFNINDRLAEITVMSRSPLSTLHHRCQLRSAILSPETVNDNVEVFRKQLHIDANANVQQICKLFESVQHKQAFKQSLAAQLQCSSREFSASLPEASEQILNVLKLIEQFFEEFSDKLFQSSAHAKLLSDLVSFRWYAGVSAAQLLYKQTSF